MSQENVDAARALVDAVNRRDQATYVALCDPEIEWTPSPEWPEAGTVRGREAVWEFFLQLDEPWEDGNYEVVEIVDFGDDKVAGRLRRSLRGRASALNVEFDYWGAMRFRDGKALRCGLFRTRREALEAIGAQG